MFKDFLILLSAVFLLFACSKNDDQGIKSQLTEEDDSYIHISRSSCCT